MAEAERPPVRILHLEDTPEDRLLVRSVLEAEGIDCEIVYADTREGFVAALDGQSFDAVLSDYALPNFDGISALGIVRERDPELPLLFVSGTMGEELAIETLKSGATDYVLKERLSRLPPALRRALAEARERRERRETQERYELVIRATHDAVWDRDIATGTVWLSEGFEYLFGWKLSELEPGVESWSSRVHPEDAERVLAGIQTLLNGKGEAWSDEYRFRRANGSYANVLDRGYVIRDPVGRPVRMIGAMMDISNRKRAEEALRESEERYRSVVEVSNEWIWETDAKGRITYSSEVCRSLVGYEPEELLGRNAFEFLHPEEVPELGEIVARSASNRTGWLGQLGRWRHKDGTYRYLESNATPLLGPQGELRGYRGAARDVTERMQLEAQLRQSQKMEAVGTLAGGIAHDFNNLLTSILGYSDLVIQQLEAGNALRADVEEIKKAGEKAATLTRQLLAFSRKQVLQAIPLDLNAVVSNLEKMLRRLLGEDLMLATVLDSELGTLKADPGQIEQVIVNLAVNARDAMPRGGKLTIETSNCEMDAEYVHHHPGSVAGSYVCLAVSDTGVGMDDQTRARIFEPFFTTKEPGKGTGLGLSTVYGIVKQSGGYINVYSEVGRGTSFRIYLPRVDATARTAPQATAEEVPGGSETVLLVEDEEAVRTLARRILESRGYTVLEASAGKDAIALVDRYPGRIDLLLTDTVMPETSGPELARTLSERRPEMKILYMSGYTDEAMVRHGLLEEGLAFIQKPFATEAMARKLREVLGEGAGPA